MNIVGLRDRTGQDEEVHPEDDIAWQVDEEEFNDLEHEQVRPAKDREFQFGGHLECTFVFASLGRRATQQQARSCPMGLLPPLHGSRASQGKNQVFRAGSLPTEASTHQEPIPG